jgi:hypothetical protein
MRIHETITYHDPQSTSMLRGYDGKHEYQHAVTEPERQPHFVRDDVPLGVIIDHPPRKVGR